MLPTRKYPAKVILFGEYTVLLGGDILAAPYGEYFSSWQLAENSDQRLLDFVDYLFELDSEALDFKLLLQLHELVLHGWQLKSTITIGAGLGSSGSVVAAIYDVVGKKNMAPDKLRSVFQKMEGYFHGESSGIDPLVSYLDTTLVIQDGNLRVIEDLMLPKFSLYDTGIERNTQSLVSWFKSQLTEHEAFANAIDELKHHNNTIITELLNGEDTTQRTKTISTLQLEILSKLIPAPLKTQWNSTSNTIWKICGAGGGGYFLQFNQV